MSKTISLPKHFIPSSWANRAATERPPLPRSREIVMRLIIIPYPVFPSGVYRVDDKLASSGPSAGGDRLPTAAKIQAYEELLSANILSNYLTPTSPGSQCDVH